VTCVYVTLSTCKPRVPVCVYCSVLIIQRPGTVPVHYRSFENHTFGGLHVAKVTHVYVTRQRVDVF